MSGAWSNPGRADSAKPAAHVITDTTAANAKPPNASWGRRETAGLVETAGPDEAVDSKPTTSDDVAATVSASRNEPEDVDGADDKRSDRPSATDVKNGDDADKGNAAASEPANEPAAN